MEVIGIKTDLVGVGEDLVEALQNGMQRAGLCFRDGDILVVSESVIATWEGRVIDLDTVEPDERAHALADHYGKDPREMALIIKESDSIVGGIPGVVLTLNDGFLYPNAGIDHSNAPPGHVILFPKDSSISAKILRERLSSGRRIGVIVGDSRTHPLRLGCVGVALACQGIVPVEDARGQDDLYGRKLMITRKAVADNLVSAAQVVMGEGDEGIPAVIIRNSPVEVIDGDDQSLFSMPRIAPHDCMYIGALTGGLRPYAGGYDWLIALAKEAIVNAYAPYSGFKVGAAILAASGRVYSAGNVENASHGAGLCAERAALAKAISAGEREISALAVVGDTPDPITPCGICRQMLVEMGKDILVIMANLGGKAAVATAGELLPNPFIGQSMAKDSDGDSLIS